jgi:predicted transposase YbfD/YdcC
METGNHVLVQLKRNQPSLYDQMVAHAAAHRPRDTARTHDIGRRSRIEQRTVHVWSLSPEDLCEAWQAPFKTLIQVQRHIERFDTPRKRWMISEETAYYLSNLVLPAASFGSIIRGHWDIENRVHYVRDVTLGEDACRIRCNPAIFALLRSFALNLLRFNGIQNISLALYDNALNFDRVRQYRGI